MAHKALKTISATPGVGKLAAGTDQLLQMIEGEELQKEIQRQYEHRDPNDPDHQFAKLVDDYGPAAVRVAGIGDRMLAGEDPFEVLADEAEKEVYSFCERKALEWLEEQRRSFFDLKRSPILDELAELNKDLDVDSLFRWNELKSKLVEIDFNELMTQLAVSTARNNKPEGIAVFQAVVDLYTTELERLNGLLTEVDQLIRDALAPNPQLEPNANRIQAAAIGPLDFFRLLRLQGIVQQQIKAAKGLIAVGKGGKAALRGLEIAEEIEAQLNRINQEQDKQKLREELKELEEKAQQLAQRAGEDANVGEPAKSPDDIAFGLTRAEREALAAKRPSRFRKGVVDKVWENAQNEGGQVFDPKTLEELKWDRNRNRDGQWEMGHINGEPYEQLRQDFLDGRISRKQFLDEYNNIGKYRPEGRSPNRGRRFD